MTDADPWPGGMVCASCRVITVRHGLGWIHPPELAEKFARSGVCADPVPARPPKPREMRFGRGANGHRDKHMLFGHADPAGSGDEVTVAADGSYLLMTSPRVRKLVSWGYVTTDGRYGLGSSAPSGAVVGDKRILVAELRAIFWGLNSTRPHQQVLLVVDSLDAVELIEAWRNGADRMPVGYNTDPRADGSPALLRQLADTVRERGPRLALRWVRGHTGVALNEGADALSKLARAWGEGRLNVATVRSDALAIADRALRAHERAPAG